MSVSFRSVCSHLFHHSIADLKEIEIIYLHKILFSTPRQIGTQMTFKDSGQKKEEKIKFCAS